MINTLITAHPEQVSLVDKNGAHLLHYACGSDYTFGTNTANRAHSLGVIKVVLDAFPAAAEVRDCQRRTPLHVVLAKGASSDIVKMIFDSCPAAEEVKDKADRTPLI